MELEITWYLVFAKHRQADTLQMLDYGYAVNII